MNRKEVSSSKELTPRETGGVREIVSNSEGWFLPSIRIEQTGEFVSGDPTLVLPDALQGLHDSWERTYTERIQKTGDFNREKVTVKSIKKIYGNDLQIKIGFTDYCTLWGMAGAAPGLHRQGFEELIAPDHKTTIPFGISTHNLVLIEGKKLSESKLVMMVQSKGHGFSAGRVSTSFEEQMERSDVHPFLTVVRGMSEELGLDGSVENLLLLGIGAEKATAYTSWVHLVHLPETSESELVSGWATSQQDQQQEGEALLVVPVSELSGWTGDHIDPTTWNQYDLQHKIDPHASLQTHATSTWRLQLLQEHIQFLTSS